MFLTANNQNCRWYLHRVPHAQGEECSRLTTLPPTIQAKNHLEVKLGYQLIMLVGIADVVVVVCGTLRVAESIVTTAFFPLLVLVSCVRHFTLNLAPSAPLAEWPVATVVPVWLSRLWPLWFPSVLIANGHCGSLPFFMTCGHWVSTSLSACKCDRMLKTKHQRQTNPDQLKQTQPKISET
jgi:hypothetical protein